MRTSQKVYKLCQVRDLMRDCFSEVLTLDDLSLEADLSPWHFLRSFRDVFGETPHDFLTRIRLERAKDLLTVTSRPVTEICFDVGFTSLGSFVTVFRRHVGLPPGRFRRLVRSWQFAEEKRKIEEKVNEECNRAAMRAAGFAL